MSSKARAAGRNHSRSQAEKPSSRPDRLAASESRADRSWNSYRHDTVPSHQAQNGPLRSNSSQSSVSNVAYGMYPLPSMNPSGLSSNGPTVPSVVMLYPYDHNTSYGSQTEHLEFGSLGPVGFSSTNEHSQASEGSRAAGAFEEPRFYRGSVQQSSPDPPSSPHYQRPLAQKNFYLKRKRLSALLHVSTRSKMAVGETLVRDCRIVRPALYTVTSLLKELSGFLMQWSLEVLLITL
ncbi:hypothetical protein RJ640_003965 [Escallonia rubra]|uniref:Uncharacterized protein n=1 Tax=Escallonia rubra TaxID=112253 RepID=A0AA88UUE4_9ASTE|nr:hypothetical protein RJ640_003965 [Escallonia rubra]